MPLLLMKFSFLLSFLRLLRLRVRWLPLPGGVGAGAEVVITRGASYTGVSDLTLWAAHLRFWPVFGGSGSESLLLEDDDPEDDVSDVSDLWAISLLDCCSVSESELESLEDDPEDDVSSSDDWSSEDVEELDCDPSKKL